jgi:2-amino-4-hydroxy-6-hydroxymethyldihydropteridine diphosphokinase
MTCYLSLGSNLGDRARNLIRAIGLLAADGRLRLRRISPLYETAPVGYADQGPFLNLALSLDTELSPEELLAGVQAVETILGRVRSFRDAPRTIDIDLLVCGEEPRDRPELALPHPRMLERQFVLAPLSHIAPELRVGAGPPIGELADRNSPDVRLIGTLRDALWSEA